MVVFSIAAVVVVIAIARCAAAAPFLHSSLTSGDLKKSGLTRWFSRRPSLFLTYHCPVTLPPRRTRCGNSLFHPI